MSELALAHYLYNTWIPLQSLQKTHFLFAGRHTVYVPLICKAFIWRYSNSFVGFFRPLLSWNYLYPFGRANVPPSTTVFSWLRFIYFLIIIKLFNPTGFVATIAFLYCQFIWKRTGCDRLPLQPVVGIYPVNKI